MTETVPKFTLKALRVNKKKTQQEIADYLEVNLRTYQKYEKTLILCHGATQKN